MVKKVVTVEPETWKALNSLKEPGESFDDVIQRILKELKKFE